MGGLVISSKASALKVALVADVGYPKKASVLAFIVLLVCWTPALIAGFPGYFTYDSGLGWLEQWGQYLTGELNSHHPVLHTLFVGLLISAGQSLFGSFNTGVLLAVLFAFPIACIRDETCRIFCVRGLSCFKSHRSAVRFLHHERRSFLGFRGSICSDGFSACEVGESERFDLCCYGLAALLGLLSSVKCHCCTPCGTSVPMPVA